MATNEPVDEPSQGAGDESISHESIREHNKMLDISIERLDDDGDNVNDRTENQGLAENTINNNDIIERNLAHFETNLTSDDRNDFSKTKDLTGSSLSDNDEDNQDVENDERPLEQDSHTKKQKDNNEENEDEELEEGELKDDDDDDDDGDDANEEVKHNDPKRLARQNDDLNNVSSKNNRRMPINRKRKLTNHFDPTNQYYNDSASGIGPTSHPYQQHQHHPHQQPHNFHPNRRHVSPNHQQQADMHGSYPPNHHFANNSNNNHFRYPPNHDGGMMGPMPSMPPHMNQITMNVGPPMLPMYPRVGGGPSNVGPVQKLNVRCRFYSKTSNKCTWGDQCRFEHRDDSPGPGEVFDHRSQPGPPHTTMPTRGGQVGPPLPPMGPADRPYPPYAARSQPYPMPPQGYVPYDPYGPQPPHHHQSPPLPQHSMQQHHWRQQQLQQQSPVYQQSPSGSAHQPPESLSPSQTAAAGSGGGGGGGGGSSSSRGGSTQPMAGPIGLSPPEAVAGAGAQSTSSSSSTAVYERRHRLAHELAPWNDRGYPPNKYERGGEPPSGYPPLPSSGRGSYHRNQYNSRDPYARDHPLQTPYYMGGGGPHPHSLYPSGYTPNYPSAYNNRGGPMGPHASHFRYMSSSQRNVPPDSRRSRSNKRGHDEDESSWSDSGSEDSILGQSSYKNKSKKLYRQNTQAQHHHDPQSHQSHQRHQETSSGTANATPLPDDNNTAENPLDHGSGTPPLPEGDRQEMLLNKLKEIEDMMERKRREQEQKDKCDE